MNRHDKLLQHEENLHHAIISAANALISAQDSVSREGCIREAIHYLKGALKNVRMELAQLDE